MFRRRPADPGSPRKGDTVPIDSATASDDSLLLPDDPGRAPPPSKTLPAEEDSETPAMRSPATPLPSDRPRRSTELPVGPRRRTAEDAVSGSRVAPEPTAPSGGTDPQAQPGTFDTVHDTERRLIVGREISLTGEINACDHLIVHGHIEARLKDCRSIGVAEGGVFKGAAEIEEADIAGRFEGELIVKGTVTVRSTGLITGTLSYGRLAVENGGQLVGSVSPLDGAQLPELVDPAATPEVAQEGAESAAPSPTPDSPTAPSQTG